MKIRSVKTNNRKKAFEVRTYSKVFDFPYAKADPRPSSSDPVSQVAVDKELGREGFVYTLTSGEEGTIHIEQVLEYNQDPSLLNELLLYRLTVISGYRHAIFLFKILTAFLDPSALLAADTVPNPPEFGGLRVC